MTDVRRSDVFSPIKTSSVDDILSIKEEVDIKREMSDQVDDKLPRFGWKCLFFLLKQTH
jgi:hypothetical protein